MASLSCNREAQRVISRTSSASRGHVRARSSAIVLSMARRMIRFYALHGGDDPITLDARVAARTRPAAWLNRPHLKRAAAELEGDDVPVLLACPAARCLAPATLLGFLPLLDSFPVRFELMTWRSWLFLCDSNRWSVSGGLKNNPPPCSLLAVGWKLFASSLPVSSPRSGSGNFFLV